MGCTRPRPGFYAAGPGSALRGTIREHDQPLAPLSPQPLNRVLAHNVSEFGTLLPAGRQDDLVIVMAAGLRAHRLDQLLLAQQATGLAADRHQAAEHKVPPVLGWSIE